ncbi:MAG TPA: beta-galactosidase trimerization domain-containing protein, partial [Phycisphaerae bacterium]|nr:beta-galactosidase trimerization domain-containing protein [Phycisphaerae bacterium]
VEYFRVQGDVFRNVLPGLPILMDVKNFDGHIPLLDRPEFSWDAAKLSAAVADLPQHTGSAEWADSLLLAFARQPRPGGDRRRSHPGWLANQGEKTFGALITQSITGPYYKDAIILNHRFGPGEVLRYFHDIGAYNYMDEQLNTDGANSWFLAMREDHAVAPEILNTRVAHGQVAVLWPDSSLRFDPDTSALREAECWADALHCLGYAYDYIFEQDLTTEGLAGYQALVLPAAWCLSDSVCGPIRQFVETGGVLIATSAPGIRDELGKLHPKWPLADLLGVIEPRFIPITPVVGTPLGIVQPEGWWEMDGIRQKEGDLTYAGRLSCTYSLPDPPAAKVTGKYPDGSPAILHRELGKGQILLLGYPFGSEYGWSNYNEIGFGKIHGDTANLRWQRELEAWLRGQMRATQRPPLGLRPVHEPGKAITLRPNGRELEAPTLGYPGGGTTWENYMLNVNDPDRTIEFTLREREGVDTKYLCVWNREGQYGASRGYVHHFAGPKYLAITVNIPDVQAIYDVSLKAPVRFEKRGNAVMFRTCLAPCMGRVFAISTGKDVTLFPGTRTSGISDDELVARCTAILGRGGRRPPDDVLIVHRDEIRAFLASLKGKPVRIGCGSPAYAELGEQLAVALRKELKCDARCTLAGVQYSADRWRHRFPAYTAQDVPEILLGNEYDNQLLASFSATPWVSGKAQNLFLPIIVNKALPGPGRGVVQLSRPYQVIDRRNRPKDEPAFYRFDPVPQRLAVGG